MNGYTEFAGLEITLFDLCDAGPESVFLDVIEWAVMARLEMLMYLPDLETMGGLAWGKVRPPLPMNVGA